MNSVSIVSAMFIPALTGVNLPGSPPAEIYLKSYFSACALSMPQGADAISI